jgi:hypothetical protein
MEIRIFAQATALVALVAGCATSTSVPKERIASSEAAVRTAEQMKQMAPATPEAEHHLKLAKEELRLAHAELDDDNDRRAEMLFIRARTDAELAQALALKARAESERLELQTEIDRLNTSTPATTTTPSSGTTSTYESTTTIEQPEEGTVEIKQETKTKKTEIKKSEAKKSDEQASSDEGTPEIPEEHEEHAENITERESDD